MSLNLRHDALKCQRSADQDCIRDISILSKVLLIFSLIYVWGGHSRTKQNILPIVSVQDISIQTVPQNYEYE